MHSFPKLLNKSLQFLQSPKESSEWLFFDDLRRRFLYPFQTLSVPAHRRRRIQIQILLFYAVIRYVRTHAYYYVRLAMLKHAYSAWSLFLLSVFYIHAPQKRAYIYVVVEASSAPSRGKRKRFSEKVIGSSA